MDAYFAHITYDCLLHFHGPQVPTFFQGQLTCDSLQVTRTRSAAGALCTSQGRVVMDCRLLQVDDGHYALRLRRDIRDITWETLKKYAMFSRTEISTQDEMWCVLGVWGDDALAAVRDTFDAVPVEREACVWVGDVMICLADDVSQALELVVPQASLANTLQALAVHAERRSEAEWRQQELRRGLVRTTVELSGKHVPQVLNYDLAGLLNFRKGCYIGQEVVARLHYKGTSKRRCAVYAATSDATIAPGTELLLPGTGGKVGNVLSVSPASDHATLVLALVTVEDSATALALSGQEPDGPLLQPVDLPYSLRGSSAAS